LRKIFAEDAIALLLALLAWSRTAFGALNARRTSLSAWREEFRERTTIMARQKAVSAAIAATVAIARPSRGFAGGIVIPSCSAGRPRNFMTEAQ